MDNTANKSSAQEIFLAYLEQQGLKLTAPRKQVMESILSKKGHFEVDDLVSTLKSQGKPVSRATVYRTLELLMNCYLVERLDFGPHGYFYEQASPETHHDHMICLQCREVIEFYSETLETAQRQMCVQHQFKDSYHSLRIFGTCAQCQQDNI